MQLKFVLPFTKVTGSGFKYSTSAVLAGITVTGVLSTVVFNSNAVNSKVSQAFESVIDAFTKSHLYDGVKEITNKLKNWAQLMVTSKDDLREWLVNYLNPNGFKSGVVEIYTKLYEWWLIVYTWFKEKFLEFVENIPKMVENWKKLRLSLFKWGTF